jgi:hypothetical protein
MNYFKKTIILIGIVVLVIIAVVFVVFHNKLGEFSYKNNIKSSQETSQQNVEKKVTLIIDDGEKNPTIIETNFKEGINAFDLLKNETEKLNISLKTKNYDIGIFIEAIGDKENGQNGKYWLYYVNGEMPQIAADKKELKPGDKVEFKFEKSPF